LFKGLNCSWRDRIYRQEAIKQEIRCYITIGITLWLQVFREGEVEVGIHAHIGAWINHRRLLGGDRVLTGAC
jgi:hypothetical protein